MIDSLKKNTDFITCEGYQWPSNTDLGLACVTVSKDIYVVAQVARSYSQCIVVDFSVRKGQYATDWDLSSPTFYLSGATYPVVGDSSDLMQFVGVIITTTIRLGSSSSLNFSYSVNVAIAYDHATKFTNLPIRYDESIDTSVKPTSLPRAYYRLYA